MPISLTMMDQLLGFAFSIGMMQYLKKNAPENEFLLYLRIAYAISILANLLVLFYIKQQILKKKDTRVIKIQQQKSFFSDEEPEELEVTHEEFDLTEHGKLVKTCLLQGVLISLGHMKWGMVQPLFIQIFSVVKMAFLSPLFLCYVRRYEIQRPYEKNMLFGLEKKKEEVVEKVVEKRRKKKED